MRQDCPAGRYIVADLADTGLAGIVPAGRYFAVDFVALDFAAPVVGPVDFAVVAVAADGNNSHNWQMSKWSAQCRWHKAPYA